MKKEMRILAAFFGVMAMGVVFGCASSYQDRLDALSQPAEAPASDDIPDDAGVSRDELLLSGACIVSADCASTQHCELGVCVSECGPDAPCADGLFCSARCRCVSDRNYVDVDPPVKATVPVNWSMDESMIRLDPAANGASLHVRVHGGGALAYRVQVEPESARTAVTLNQYKGNIGSGGTATLNVSVDRQAFGDGDHRVSINVISDNGQENAVVEFSNGIDGRYGGFINYTNPGLGRVPIVVDLTVDETGKLLGRIVTAGSLLFPEERTLRGQYDSANKTLYFTAKDEVEKDGAYDPFDRAVGREINFLGEVSEQRAVKGDIEEFISGLMPQELQVEGEFYITRTASEVDPVTALADPAMPAYPAVATAYAACNGFSTTCDSHLEYRSNMIACSAALRSTAFNLGTSFSGVDGQGKPIVDFGLVEECEKDVAGMGTHACVDIDDMRCLAGDEQHYLLGSVPQAAEYSRYYDDLKALMRTYAFIGNDLLVDAYRTSIESVSNPLSTEIQRLEEALDHYLNAESVFFGAANISTMVKSGTTSISENDFDVLRVPLQYIRSSQAALQRIASLAMRRDLARTDKRPELRRRTQDHARVIFLEGVALAQLVNASGGEFENELAQVADELGSAARLASVIDGGLNPLGYPNDYVPFIYDPADAQHANNFAQLLDSASSVVGSALAKAQTANAQVEEMQVRTEDIAKKMQDIELAYESEIEQICGIDAIGDLGECGQSGGELALVFSDIEQQYIAIESVHQQIMDVNEMVKIKRDMALQIMHARGKTLTFMQANGTKLEALEMAHAEVQMAMLRKSSLLGTIGGFVSGALGIAGGIGSMFVADVTPGNGSGGIAGGVSSLIGAGLSAAGGASSADAAKAMGVIAQQKAHLQNMQQMRLQEESMEIAAIEAAAAVKMLLLQMAELNLHMLMEDLRLTQHTIRATNLMARVDFLKHQRDVLIAQETESVNNPLSNLSFRLKRDHAVIMAANEFEAALSRVYLAARGLEHELNVNLPQIESQLMGAESAQQLSGFQNCLATWYDDYAIAFGSPHEEVTQLSLREDILGFTEPVTDEVTGEVIEAQEIFRRVLLAPKHITQTGRVEFPFVTSIIGENIQFSQLVCNDRIKSIRVQLVGDFLGDNEATVLLRQEGDSYLRDCASNPDKGEDVLTTYHLDARTAHVQAGVNSFGLASPNYELAGRSVASDRWVLIVPTGSQAPNNSDLDLLNIDDVIIEITHTARTLSGNNPTNVFGQCNI